VVHRDVGRNIAPLFAATRGGLRDAVSAIANTPGPIGLITGFYVPGGIPPAAETDGPVATALLARALRRVGIACRICTDAPCVSACVAALAAADAIDVAIDVVPLGGDVAEAIATWRAYRVKLAIAIERCGRTKDGTARNMRGEDISAETTLLDGLFLAGPWDTAAIGDGGNEIGTGGLSRALVADCIAHGETIAPDPGGRLALGRVCATRRISGATPGLAGHDGRLPRSTTGPVDSGIDSTQWPRGRRCDPPADCDNRQPGAGSAPPGIASDSDAGDIGGSHSSSLSGRSGGEEKGRK
jgi:D-glutamate cyclase-like protein